MSKNKTNLGKRVHEYKNVDDMAKQFGHDVGMIGSLFAKMVDDLFDLTNPWDQSVLGAILTNMLAYLEVNAEIDGCNMEKPMKTSYELCREDYRKQVIENEKNKNK